MSQISLTVPSDDERALVAAGTFFLTLAGKVPALELDDAPEATHGPTITTDSVKEKLPDAFLKLDESGEWVDPTAEGRTVEAVGDLDANDLPWDPRIHASSKALNKDNTWRYKRGVDRDVVEAVEAELKGLLSAPPPPVQETTAPPPPPPPVQETAPPPPPPPAQETTAPPPPAQGVTVPEFLKLITSGIQAKTWTMADVEAAILAQGVAGVEKVPHLMARKDLIPNVLEVLQA